MVSPKRNVEEKTVNYSEKDWALLENYRDKGERFLSVLSDFDLRGFIYGSVARGDVNENSDIDIIILDKSPSYKVELALKEGGFENFRKKLAIATPWHLPKVHYLIGEKAMVTIPLENPKEVERDFYKFGGLLNFKDLKERKRVSGVDKRLVLIEPIKKGHKENQVIGNEGKVSKKLDVCLEIVEERVEVLTRRNNVGKTGIFLEKEIPQERSPEEIWKKIKDKNPEISKRKDKKE